MKTSNVNQGRAHPEAIIRGWVSNKRAGSSGVTVGDGSTTGDGITNITVTGGGGTVTIPGDGTAVINIPGRGSGTPGWFNVRDYGAVGDGSTDDTSAINDAIAALILVGSGVLYFPAGTYKVTAGLTALSVPCLVLGDGRASTDGTTDSISQVRFDTTSGTLFTVTSDNVSFSKLALYNGTGGTLTAGAAISVTAGGSWALYEALSIYGFYMGMDIQEGGSWSMRDCHVHHFKKYGVKIRNISSPQGGDWSMVGCYIVDGAHNADAGIRFESGAGGKIVNCKINSNSSGINHGIDVAPVTTITDLQISNTSIEGFRGDAIHIASGAGAGFYHITIVGNQIAQDGSYNSIGNGISISANTAGDITGVVITGNAVQVGPGGGSSTGYAVKLTKADRTLVSDIIVGVPSGGYAGVLNTSGCTNILDYTGGVAAGVAITGTPSSGQVPTATGAGAATWQTPSAGFTNPMTTSQDIIVGGASGAAGRLAVGAAGAALSIINSAVAWNSGTSFPGSKATGDRYWRTDLGLEAFWDGTRWLTTQLFREPMQVGNVTMPDTVGTAWGRMAMYGTTFDIWLVNWDISTYVATTNSGTSFWTASLNKYIANDTATAIDSFTTAADTVNTWTKRRRAIGASVAAATYFGLSVTGGKTSTPGGIYSASALEYRLILT